MSNELDGNSLNEKKEPKLPKINKNVKSMNQINIKSDDTIASLIGKYGERAKGMISRLMGGVPDPEVDQMYKKTLSKTKKEYP